CESRDRPRAQPIERRQGGAYTDSVAHRGAAQGALAPRSQAERRRAEQRAPGPPRRERAAEEAAQGPQDLRRRRAEGPRRSPEADRQPHQTDRRSAEEERSGIAWKVKSTVGKWVNW